MPIEHPCPAPRLPDEESNLSSGNKFLKFNNIWENTILFNRREPCRLGLELDGDLIVAVTHDGAGCYQNY